MKLPRGTRLAIRQALRNTHTPVETERILTRTQVLYNAFIREAPAPGGMNMGYLKTNPAEGCILPRIQQKEIRPLDTPEITRFFEAIKGHKYEILFKVDVFTGLRSGEILGLTWDCVDFDAGTIFICKQLCPPRVKGATYAFGTLKNDKPRTITPAPYVMQLLKQRKREQNIQRLEAGGSMG